MADPIYTAASPIAVNPGNGRLIGGATFTVHAPDDTSFSNPLQVTDPITGVAISPLRSNANGTLPAFMVPGNLPRVILKSGAFVTELVSLSGLVAEEVSNAGLSAENIADAIAAGQAAGAQAAIASRFATDAADAAAAAAQKAAAVAGVIATSDGIMAAIIRDLSSQFRAALDDIIASLGGGGGGFVGPVIAVAAWTGTAWPARPDAPLVAWTSLPFSDPAIPKPLLMKPTDIWLGDQDNLIIKALP